jgi:DNA-directed RNA polymerase specialized sigma24 family protein
MSNPSSEDDEDKRWMALIAKGDENALRQLIDRHHPRLVGYLKFGIRFTNYG